MDISGDMAIENARQLAVLEQSVKSAHHRIDENDRIISGIHELAKNIAALTTEMKLLGERVDKSIERIEQGQKAQGERVGNIEKSIMAIERNEKAIVNHEERLDKIEREPGDKWNKLVWLLVSGIGTGVLGFVMAQLF